MTAACEKILLRLQNHFVINFFLLQFQLFGLITLKAKDKRIVGWLQLKGKTPVGLCAS